MVGEAFGDEGRCSRSGIEARRGTTRTERKMGECTHHEGSAQSSNAYKAKRRSTSTGAVGNTRVGASRCWPAGQAGKGGRWATNPVKRGRAQAREEVVTSQVPVETGQK